MAQISTCCHILRSSDSYICHMDDMHTAAGSHQAIIVVHVSLSSVSADVTLDRQLICRFTTEMNKTLSLSTNRSYFRVHTEIC